MNDNKAKPYQIGKFDNYVWVCLDTYMVILRKLVFQKMNDHWKNI